MNGIDLPLPASAAARRFTSLCLLGLSALLLTLVLRLNHEAQALPVGADATLAQVKLHGLAVLLGAMAMLNIAWFGALARAQAEQARIRARITGGP